MDSLYFRQQMMYQMMPQMAMAMAFAGTSAGSMAVTPGMMQPNQIAFALAINGSLGMGWAGYSGGMQGMASAYGNMGSFGSMAMAFSMSMPGPYAMGAIAMAGANSMGMDSQMIDVAGTGMGKDKSYSMLPGEMLAVYSLLQDKKNMSPEEMQKQLSEKYGLDVEVKKEDGKATLVNKSTGNVIMSDGNGNNIMEAGDMKFKEAFEQMGLNIKDFEGKDGAKKLEMLTQSMLYGQGMGMGMGLGIGMGFNPFGSSAYGMMPPFGIPLNMGLNPGLGMNQGYGMYPGYGMDQGYGAYPGYGTYPGTGTGQMYNNGIMNDPRQMQMMMMLMMLALQYATMMQYGQNNQGYGLGYR